MRPPLGLGLALSAALSVIACRPAVQGRSTLPPGEATTRAPTVTGANFAALVRALDEEPASASNRPLRDAVAVYWAARGLERLGAGDYERAVGALRGALVHYSPDELRGGRLPDALAPLARGLLGVANPRGDEPRVLAANRVLSLLRTPDREAEDRFQEVLRWGESNRREFRAPWVFHGEMADIFREVARLLPERSMLERSREHSERRRAEALREMARPTPEPRTPEQVIPLRRAVERAAIDVTILDLRIGDVAAAAEHVEAMTGTGSRGLAALLRAVVESDAPEGYLSLAEQLDRVDVAAMAGVCREGRRRFSDDPRFALCLARAAEREEEFGVCAMHFEAASRLREEDPEALGRAIAATARWLDRESTAEDPASGRAAIAQLRALSAAWSRRFAGRPPPLDEGEIDLAAAHFEVANGNLTAADALLDRASRASRTPRGALLLRAEIAWRQRDGRRAEAALQQAAQLPLAAHESSSELQPLIQLRRALALSTQGQTAVAQSLFTEAEAGFAALARSLEGGAKARALMQHALAADALGRTEAAQASWDAALAAAPDDREVAASAVVFFMGRARWAEAARIARSARARLTLDRNWEAYFALWHWCSSKLARDEDERARAALRELASTATSRSPWTVRLAQRTTGSLSFDELLSLASTPGQRAEAHFYEGLVKLAEGDRATALERLRSTLATNMLYYNEYHVAWDLERLLDTAPSTSR
jgi:tetratricopeptide (TPR) repeat protein